MGCGSSFGMAPSCPDSKDPDLKKPAADAIVPSAPSKGPPQSTEDVSVSFKKRRPSTRFQGSKQYLENFVSFSREERKAACEQAFLHPKDPNDQKLLAEIIDGIRESPTDVDTQKQLLSNLYQLWNRLLADLEDGWSNQGPPMPIMLGGKTIIVVLGGKYQTGGLRGLGDELVHMLLEMDEVQVLSYSRGAAAAPPASCSAKYAHHQTLDSLMAQVAADKKGDAKVLFVYTIGVTADNRECIINNDMVDQFGAACDAQKLLQDRNVRVLQTSSFHASPKDAGYEDNLADNYGLADYGASKVLQTMQLLDLVHSHDEAVCSSDAFQRLQHHLNELRKELELARAHWAENPAHAKARSCPKEFELGYTKLVSAMSQASRDLFEDTSGEQSIICQIQMLSNRFEVVKIPYMLSNTAIYKRLFVFDPAAQRGKDPWDFFVMCSFKRFRIVMTPQRGAAWHLSTAVGLMHVNCTTKGIHSVSS